LRSPLETAAHVDVLLARRWQRGRGLVLRPGDGGIRNGPGGLPAALPPRAAAAGRAPSA
jgi:hypothetical protein